MSRAMRRNPGRSRLSRRSVLRGGVVGGTGLIAASLVGCGDEDEATPGPTTNGDDEATPVEAAEPDGDRHGGVVRGDLITNQDLPDFDLHGASSALMAWSMGLCYDQLVQFDPFEVDHVIPNLAHSWEYADDTTLVFQLNEADFHDGTPFTSEDVAASIDRQKNPPEGLVSPRQAQFGAIDNIETPDDRTVVFNLSRPSASLLPTLAVTYVAMYSKADLDADPLFNQGEINGTGPFTLERYDRGSMLRFERNPNYYAEDGELPYLDGVEYYVIPEEVGRFAAFQGGDLDMLGPGATQAPQIESDMPDVTLMSTAGTAYYATTIATWMEPWNDERTWEAIALAINKQDANQVISAGRGFVGGPLPPGTMWALPEEDLLQVPGYKGLGDGSESDMDARWTEARRLLDAAGVEDGRVVRLFGRDVFEDWALVFADGLTNVGLVPEISLHERGVYDERLAARDYGDMSANSRGAVFPDPSPVFADNYLDGAGRHYTGLVVPEVEELYERQEQALEPEEREELALEMQREFLRTYPAEISAFTETRYALRDYVRDYGELYGSIHVSRKLQWLWLDR